MPVSRLARALSLACMAVFASSRGAEAATTTGGVTWIEPLAFSKPAFVPLTIPTIATDYWIDMTSGSDTASCGLATGTPCSDVRGLIRTSGTGAARSLSGLRGNAGDGAAAINIKGTGCGDFFSFNDTLAGTSGKEILIRPWGTSTVTFNRCGTNQGLNNDGNDNVGYIIIDGGNPSTGEMLFKFVSDANGCSSFCGSLAIVGSHITIARTQFTASGSSGSGQFEGVLFCNVDSMACDDFTMVNVECYGFVPAGSDDQGSCMYAGSCGAAGGCSVSNVRFLNSICRETDGECVELNPRVTSSVFLIANNAFHNVGKGTCRSSTWSCRPAILTNINQSGATNLAVIANNIIWNTGSGCIWEKSHSTGANAAKVFNNTCYDYGKGASNNGQPFGINGATSGSDGFNSVMLAENNTICEQGGINPFSTALASHTTASNLVKSGESGGTSSVTAASCSAMFLSVDENTANFLKIDASSPGYNAGADLSATITDDYLGISRPKATTFDIGAFEFDAGGDTTDPVVTITAPATGTYATGTSPLTTLAGTCSDDTAVSSVAWSNSTGGSGSATGTTSWTVASITLTRGSNVITVTCTDTSTNTDTDTLTVTYVAPGSRVKPRLRFRVEWIPTFPHTVITRLFIRN